MNAAEKNTIVTEQIYYIILAKIVLCSPTSLALQLDLKTIKTSIIPLY
jgi:hypothetical protein